MIEKKMKDFHPQKIERLKQMKCREVWRSNNLVEPTDQVA
jgi:hypothetical protein